MGHLFNNILETIGKTPTIRLNKIGPKGVNIYVKVESFNPMGSVKDRLALGVVEDAERRGTLKPGQTVVEATSGNTGIGLAMVCAQKGYPLVITMAENFSVERRKMMRFLGAEVVLTPASEKGSGMLKKAEELAAEHGWWLAKQFENNANAEMHEKTTAVEILDDFSEIGLDYFVSGYGSGGTLNGISKVLKAKSPKTKIMAAEPDNSQVLGSGLAQPENASHPNFRPHLMQGWSPDFIPALIERTVDDNRIDAVIPVDGNFSLQCTHDLATKEGIFAGITAGATLAAALEIAKTAPECSNILCMVPDTGERYLTTPLFENIATEMTDAEIAISKSTPNYRFDVSAAPAPSPATPAASIVLDDAAIAAVASNIANPDTKVVMFALEWCEFCWSVRKALKEYDIDFKSVDLDSVEYQDDNMGGKMRAALADKTGINTFPQIFIDGEFVGGCTELFDAIKDGSALDKMTKANVAFAADGKPDPYSFLPKWLHPR